MASDNKWQRGLREEGAGLINQRTLHMTSRIAKDYLFLIPTKKKRPRESVLATDWGRYMESVADLRRLCSQMESALDVLLPSIILLPDWSPLAEAELRTFGPVS